MGTYVFVIEMQNRIEPKKKSNWAYYPAYLHERTGHPVVTLVVCNDESVAEWAREPYSIGLPSKPGLVAKPLVVGPSDMPKITDAEEAAKSLDLAVFAAMIHCKSPESDAILRAVTMALEARGQEDWEDALSLFDYLQLGLEGTPAFKHLEEIMATDVAPRLRFAFEEERLAEGRAEGREKGREEGHARGLAEAVLKVLDAREVSVPPQVRESVLACTDEDRLTSWLTQAASATSIEDLADL